MAELALVLTLFLFLLLTFLELASLVSQRLAVGAAAREGARQAAIDGGESSAARRLATQVLAAAGVEGGHFSVTPARAGYGKLIEVRVTATYRFRLAPLRLLAGEGVVLKGGAVVRSERGGRP